MARCLTRCSAAYGAGRVLLKPASPGTGRNRGWTGSRGAWSRLECSDILTKTIGTNNPRNVVNAVIGGPFGAARIPMNVSRSWDGKL